MLVSPTTFIYLYLHCFALVFNFNNLLLKINNQKHIAVDLVLGSHLRDLEEWEKPHCKKYEDQAQQNTTIVSSKSYLKWFVSSEGDEENEESEYEDEESDEADLGIHLRYLS